MSYFSVEIIVLGRQHNLLQFTRDSRYSRKVDAIVVNTKKLMHHRLVSPLKQQRY